MLNFFYRFSRTSTAFRGKNIVCFFIRRLSMSTGLVIAGFFFRLGHCHEKNTHCSSCFEFFFFYCRHSKLMSTPSVSFRFYSVDTLYNFILSLQFPLQSRAVLQLKKKKSIRVVFAFSLISPEQKNPVPVRSSGEVSMVTYCSSEWLKPSNNQ